MGVLKLRDLDQIHDRKKILYNSAGNTVPTYVNHKEYEFKGLVSKTNYTTYGCCTSYSEQCNSLSIKYENSFIGLKTEYFPSSYKNMELVTKWVDFMNGLFPFFDIKIVTDFKQNIINPEYWIEKELRFTFENDKIYFVIKKDITKNKYFNLFQLSLLRYFVSNEYYFMIYDCLRIREKKSLSKLSNWQIMNIARFGVQTNKQQFSTRMGTSYYEYAFLRDYRSPIFNRCYTHSLSKEQDVISKLENYDSQNTACQNKHLKINIIYLMRLFELGHFIKLYKIITDSKHEILNDPGSNKLSKFINETYHNNYSFNHINNLPFNLKEYEKTL